MDNGVSISFVTPGDVQRELSARLRARRLALNLTQEGLSARADVSWGTVKRFERTGRIALDALLKLALVLDCLGDFDRVCTEDGRSLATKSLDDILDMPKPRRKGRIR